MATRRTEWVVRASQHAADSPLSRPREERVSVAEATFMQSAIEVVRNRMRAIFGYDWLSLCLFVEVRYVAVDVVDAVESTKAVDTEPVSP